MTVTLAPFRFDPSGFEDPAWRGIEFTNVVEPFANVLLFVPVGFGFSALIRRIVASRILQIGLVLVLGVGTTLGVEVLQMAIPQRVTSLTDVAANSIGIAIGILLFAYQRASIVRMLSRAALRIADRRVLRWLMTGIALYMLAIVVVSALLGAQPQAWSLRNWDLSYPLILGDEATGDRPWRGRVSNIAIADHVVDETEADQFITGATTEIEGEILRVQSNDYTKLDSADTRTAGPRYGMRVQKAIPGALSRIREAGAFSVLLEFETSAADQSGPARILSISANPELRNLTIGQEGRSLVIRVRTPFTGLNGIRPEFVIPDYFEGQVAHRLVVSYELGRLRVYDSSKGRLEVRMHPETTVFWGAFSSPRTLNIQNREADTYRLLFYAFVFSPLGFLMALPSAVYRSRKWITVGLVAGVATLLALQIVLRNPSVLSTAYGCACFAAGFIVSRRFVPDILIQRQTAPRVV